MFKRLLTAAVALGVMTPFLIFSDTPMMLVFSGGLTEIALFEILKCSGYIKNPFIAVPTFAAGAATVVATRLAPSADRYLAWIFVCLFIYTVYILTASVFSRGTVPVDSAALIGVLCAYTAFGFASIVLLRDLKGGQYIYLLVFLVPWISDSCAYFIGTRFGRRRLIPDVSPKKTVEGAVGGIVCGTLSAIIYGFVVSLIFEAGGVDYPALAACGFVMSLLSQCGDLIASLVKRHYGVKDYGDIFPGHGGVMDRFDSVLSTAPFLYILLLSSPFFKFFI